MLSRKETIQKSTVPVKNKSGGAADQSEPVTAKSKSGRASDQRKDLATRAPSAPPPRFLSRRSRFFVDRTASPTPAIRSAKPHETGAKGREEGMCVVRSFH